MQLQGSVALVTGANHGLGRAFAEALLAAGAAKVYAAAQVLAALEAGREEVLADELTRNVKRGLGAEPASYRQGA